MYKFIAFLVVFISLSGCANQKYGDFTKDTEGTIAQQVVDDAVKRLTSSYPAGKTIFRLDNTTTKEAGEKLELVLRDAGFGVSYEEGIPLNYIFDNYSEDKKSDQYRLTLIVDTVEFSRIYFFNRKQNELLTSSWTVVER